MTTETLAAPAQTTYDEVPYTSHPFPQTHPDRLATAATLMGLKPPPVTRCRVLELGAASGGNLIPQAVALPESRFVGLDLSARQVEDGQKVIQALGLTNVELKHLSILDVGPDLGTFDYVICHGVYSWVPDAVRDKILAVCSANLAPDGVAYVSYNTYPGWHMRGMIRDMMFYHAQKFPDPKRKVSQARALLDFLAESAPDKEGAYGTMLKQELKILRDKPDDYLLHEHLEEVNDPVYFYQFIQEAAGHGLAYLGEAAVGTMASNNFPMKVQDALNRVARDQVQREQYMDFLRNRTFRQTLLVHQSRQFTHKVDPARVADLYMTSNAQPTDGVDLVADRLDKFKGPQLSTTLSTRDPLLKAALLELAPLWPRGLPFGELLARANERARAAGVTFPDAWLPDARRLGAGVLNCYLNNLLEMSPRASDFTNEVSERPVACPLSRYQARTGAVATNRRHSSVKLSDAERNLLPLLDGTRDRTALIAELVELCKRGVLTARHEGQAVTDPDKMHATIANALPALLGRLARAALLVG